MQTYWQKSNQIIGKFINIHSFNERGHLPDIEVRRTAEKYIIDNKFNSVLDAGCNTGILGYRLQQAEFKGKYIGVDSNQKAIDLARKINPLQFICCDITNIPQEDRSIECVYTKDVIEHMEYYEKPIEELCRICKDTFMVSTFILMGQEDKINLHKDGYYLNSYNRKKFLEFVCNFGFELVSSIDCEKEFGLLIFERVR